MSHNFFVGDPSDWEETGEGLLDPSTSWSPHELLSSLNIVEEESGEKNAQLEEEKLTALENE